jgi:1-acyl-sn-glycerol-3-phosphate acyltransferase
VDPFGLDIDYIRQIALPAYMLYRYYFRVQTQGAEHVPAGRCLLISNHSGQLPWDGMMISAAVLRECEPPRVVRSMVDRFVYKLPFLSYVFPRLGQIMGTPENAKELLKQGEVLLAFPEGVRGLNKTWDKRYQLQEFGNGFMRLAMETDTPIVPVAVVGAEEQAPSFYNAEAIGKLFGMPAFPITPTNPWLPLIGMMPYPSRYHIRFLEPLHFSGDPEDDDEVISHQADVVKGTIQQALGEMLAQRTSIYV